MLIGTPMLSKLQFCTRSDSFARFYGIPPHTAEAYAAVPVDRSLYFAHILRQFRLPEVTHDQAVNLVVCLLNYLSC